MNTTERALSIALDTLSAMKDQRDRCQETLDAIGELPWCENCAPGYNLIGSALLDGEDK